MLLLLLLLLTMAVGRQLAACSYVGPVLPVVEAERDFGVIWCMVRLAVELPVIVSAVGIDKSASTTQPEE